MAATVTAVTQIIKGCEGSLTSDYKGDSVQEQFRIVLAAQSKDLPSIVNGAVIVGAGIGFPAVGNPWPGNPTYGLYAKTFQLTPFNNLLTQYICTITYQPLEPGEPNTQGSGTNPLGWPKTYWLEWLEQEILIQEARNIEAFTGGSGRTAGTLGPVVNTAYQEFEEPLVDSVREAVLCVKQNVATLTDVLNLESTYALTTNSDTVYGIGPRRLKYVGVESSGKLTANGIDYYERTVRVQVKKTTDRYVNNIGWKCFGPPGAESKIVPCVVDEVQYNDEGVAEDPPKTKKTPVSEPVFLDLAGKQKEKVPLKIGYRYLTEVAYASLLS